MRSIAAKRVFIETKEIDSQRKNKRKTQHKKTDVRPRAQIRNKGKWARNGPGVRNTYKKGEVG